jgi:hypothetical protein
MIFKLIMSEYTISFLISSFETDPRPLPDFWDLLVKGVFAFDCVNLAKESLNFGALLILWFGAETWF